MRNVPVVHPNIDLSQVDVESELVTEEIIDACQMRDVDKCGPVALAFSWSGEPSYQRPKAVADAIDGALCRRSELPLVVVIDGDVGRLLGRILSKN